MDSSEKNIKATGMERKIRSVITDVTVNGAVFRNETIRPAQINFFYGKNGSGKSTIARALKQPDRCSWHRGVDPASVEVDVYDEEFIRENIQSYGNLPGVFTISREDAAARQRIDKLKAEKNAAILEMDAAEEAEARERKEADRAYKDLADKVWKRTRDLAGLFRETQTGCLRDKKKFAGKLMQAQPVSCDLEELERSYRVAYGGAGRKFTHFNQIPSDGLPESDLLDKQIVSSGSTPFSSFVKALNALPWIRQGHEAFHEKADGRCPYCQQELPDSFEEDLAACYDRQYSRDLSELESFQERYRGALNGIYTTLNGNLKIEFESPLIETYQDKIGLFVEKGKRNVERIRAKLQKPEEEVTLENLDGILAEIAGLISRINDQITGNNDILDHIDTQKQNITKSVWELMSFICRPETAEYRAASGGFQTRISNAAEQQETLRDDLKKIDGELAELNRRTADTTAVMEQINRELDLNGFRGFRLREKENEKYTYELVRDDGTVAVGLSEGERRMVSFLYFYHLVTGSPAGGNPRREKIVVIDDPVSGLDPAGTAMVARLVRNLAAICRNDRETSGSTEPEGDIGQLFCLTHDPSLFREISGDLVSNYRCVSFFEVRKDKNNVSSVIPCVEKCPGPDGGEMNFSPVKNYYDGLWTDYRHTEDPTALVNVMTGILEYYLIRTCRCTTADLRERLSGEKESGQISGPEYSLADALLEILDAQHGEMGNDVVFDFPRADTDEWRKVFRTLFRLAGQERHYLAKMKE